MSILQTIEELFDFRTEFQEYDDLTIRSRKINNYAAVITLWGPHVINYIGESIRVRANDQLSFSNAVNKLLFHRILGSRFQFEFNQNIKIEKELILDKIEQLLNQGYDFAKIKQKIQHEQREFYNYKLDVQIEIANLTEKRLSFETKLFTCPDQGASILSKHLTPGSLTRYFQTRDFMGLITFSHMVDSNEPNRSFRFPDEVPLRQRFDWFLHFIVFDYRILDDSRASTDIGNEMIAAIQQDHEKFLEKLSLNRYPCSIRLIENYLKVVHMSYIIQELEEKVERERQEKERERQEKERERQEKERQQKELIRQRKQFLQFLKNKKIPDNEIEEFMKKLTETPD